MYLQSFSGFRANLERRYKQKKSPAFDSVICCLCKALLFVVYGMERFTFFRLMRPAPK